MRQIFINALLLTTLAIMTTACTDNSAKDPTAKAMEQISEILEKRYDIKDEIAPGAAVIIKKGDSILLEKYIGYADLFFKKPIDRLTHFNIASCTKQFTAAAILKMQELGQIDINKSIYELSPEINKYLPPKKKPFTDITTATLMAHSSGIPDARPREDKDFVLYATDMQSIEYIKNLDSLHFEPGTQYEYINPTFQLLYLFIEKLTGNNYEDYMENNIFKPSLMYTAKFFEPYRQIFHPSHGYIPDAQSYGGWKEYDYGEESFFATKADGGLYITAREMLHWLDALRDNVVLNEHSRSLMWRPTTQVSGSKFCDYQNRPNTFYGLGWFIEQQPNLPLKVYHTGDNGGFQAYEGYFPEADVAVVILENRNDKPRWELVEQIDNILNQANLLAPIKVTEN